jgi:hypothetical protein
MVDHCFVSILYRTTPVVALIEDGFPDVSPCLADPNPSSIIATTGAIDRCRGSADRITVRHGPS